MKDRPWGIKKTGRENALGGSLLPPERPRGISCPILQSGQGAFTRYMPFKIYVDSRFKKLTGGSTSDSEFTIEIPHPIQVKGKAFVDTILIPNSFYVIRANENDKIYLSENSTVYRIVTIAQGQYNAMTLKDAVLVALQTGRKVNYK